MKQTYTAFFKQATDSSPYPFQEAFAECATLPHLLRAPTGAGKTATAILGWLWRLLHSGKPTPRRLVYCLPMRVLVEQSYGEARGWLENLKLTSNVGLHQLMGGEELGDWHLKPEKPSILIGTQDMLLSRALNRGYAASRFHWPIDFGLLNNDCLWVYDEPQLMGSGVSTSAQMAGLRAALGSMGDCPSLWMSATLEPEWLETVDFRGKFTAPPLELTAADFAPGLPLHKRMTASKKLTPLAALSNKEMTAVAKAVVEQHQSGTQTLVIVNTVDRARALYAAIQKDKKATKNLLLVHSRFRPQERIKLNERLQQKGLETHDRIIVATQVVEAGVDISSRTLITELAPWSSIVQRIGRCNRAGDDAPGRVLWIDLGDERLQLPYEPNDLDTARKYLVKLSEQDVSPQSLEEFKKQEGLKLPFEHIHVLRRRDLMDLFDTSPDLSGNDIDIQRFVRGDDREADLQVFWRKLTTDIPTPNEVGPDRQEICNVPVGAFRDFMKKNKIAAFRWDHLDEAWRQVKADEIRPGLVLLLPSKAGGYSIERGWDVESDTAVEPVELQVTPDSPEAVDSDPNSCGPALSIAAHTENVSRTLLEILDSLGNITELHRAQLIRAARWHDIGKGHRAFQHGLRIANPDLGTEILWAKSGNHKRLKHGRRYFRHELASALAAIQQGLSFEEAYLIAAHHGRVRISIRSLPDECQPQDSKTLFALGVHDGDSLPEVDLGDETCPALTLSLAPMQLGGESSWTAQAIELRDNLGPFKLAYLEALLRAADVRASKNERKENSNA